MDSGNINLAADALTGIPVSGQLLSQLTINAGERIRYHVSAEKVGTAGASVTMEVFYGSNYNSFYDVPVTFNTDSVLNKSGVPGVTDTDALNFLYRDELAYACSDEDSALNISSRITFRMPHAMILSSVRISLNTAPTISPFIVDVKENGISIFSTLLSIDATEKTSVTAAIPAVISDVNLADDSEISVSITQIGSGVAGAGLKILFIGKRV